MSKIDFKIEDNKLKVMGDSNEDGPASLTLELNLTEAVQEAFSKGDAIEGAKVVDVKFTGTQLVVMVDSDKDGEKLLDLTLDLAEALDESGLLK